MFSRSGLSLFTVYVQVILNIRSWLRLFCPVLVQGKTNQARSSPAKKKPQLITECPETQPGNRAHFCGIPSLSECAFYPWREGIFLDRKGHISPLQRPSPAAATQKLLKHPKHFRHSSLRSVLASNVSVYKGAIGWESERVIENVKTIRSLSKIIPQGHSPSFITTRQRDVTLKDLMPGCWLFFSFIRYHLSRCSGIHTVA